MWHNLTKHPAHQKKPEESSVGPEKKTDETSEKKPSEEPKKDAGSGSSSG